MKKYLLYTSLLSGILTLNSCNDFLDVNPSSGFTPEYILSSEEELKALMGRIYSSMTEDGLYGSTLASGLNTNTDVEMSSFENNTINSAGSDIGCFDARPVWGTLNSAWNNLYFVINYANDFIQTVEGSDEFSTVVTDNTPTETQQMYGEVKTLRAMFYLDLIRTWGDVVFVTKPTTSSDDFFSRGTTDRNVILDSLIVDLQNVEPLMKYAADLDYGVERASREYCQALIGQLALYRGGWSLRADKDNPASVGYMERGDNFEYYYNIAIEYLGKVIDEGKHDLIQSFEDLWKNECNWKTANNDDVLFAVPMLKGVTSRFGYNIGVTITEGDHEYGSARNYVTFCGTYVYSFDKDDLRRDMTCVPYKYDENLNQEYDMGITGMGAGKWSKLYMQSPLGATSGSNTGINNVRMRFADVLLMYAEAVNELYGPRDDAKEALKRVRRRAFDSALWSVKVDGYVDALTNEELFFQAIMNERKWEFGGEGIRKYDLARWNKYGEVIYDLYHQMINWGLVAQGQSVPGIEKVPEYIYYKQIPDPEYPERMILDIVGIDEYGPGIGRPSGYEMEEYAFGWRILNQETQQYESAPEIYWSFRGFINKNNENTVKRTDPLRYLCPYPSKVITDHRGMIKNYYGY
ncbi:RagB/SusD family nutrient uptake outer membrane protein [uncultured Bacteroides sp.]|uniref:RagB/SusD family nutrient uptake outer membrane protein n=1 Tax=uncultured Bacteroides sp. TaxID=162156 RepID=UPI0025EA199E|nr:RagB/SusD family nutrient uptake outer membrane protein [uncultured Bacteroides sp.]